MTEPTPTVQPSPETEPAETLPPETQPQAPMLDDPLGPDGTTDGWRRLDLRMLLVHPVNEVVRFLPGLVAIFFLGRNSGPDDGRAWWHYGALAVVIALGFLRYLTTTYRISPEQVQLRKGLVSRHTLSTRLDRVRTIDLTSSPIHRLLGLSKVVIGTGSGATGRDERIALDSLGTEAARALRRELLHTDGPNIEGERTSAGDRPIPPHQGADVAGSTASTPDRVLVRLDPAWVRYAPLTTGGIVTAAAALGFLANLINQTAQTFWGDIADQADSISLGWPLVAAIGTVVVLVGISALAIAGYLLANWGFTVSHNEAGRSYHLRRGLLTTRETSIDDERIRGLEVGEPLGLRLAGGGRLAVIVTGLDRRERGNSTLVPPAPAVVVHSVGEVVLGEEGPLTVPLVQHGAGARKRRWTRVMMPTLVLIAVLVAVVVIEDWNGLLVLPTVVVLSAAALLARDRYAGLGHALTDRYVVFRSGSFSRRRDALLREGIIGWNLRASFWQRRAGVANVTATTAAGKQEYTAYDMPYAEAVALATDATPGLLDQFLA